MKKPSLHSPSLHRMRGFIKHTAPKTISRVAVDTYRQMTQAQLFMVASSLSYTTILSLVPALAVSFVMFKAFGGMDRLYGVIEPFLMANLTEETGKQVIATLHRLIDGAHTAALGIGGLLGLIVTSMTMLSSIEKAINYVWQVKVQRKLFNRIASYWLFITLGPLALSIAVGAATSSNFPLARLLPSGTGMFVISVSLFFCVYKWVPQTQVHPFHALISAFFSAILWILARAGYGLYTKNAVSYNTIYGSLGAIPIFLLWIYIVWVIVLGGAALTAALQKRVKAPDGR